MLLSLFLKFLEVPPTPQHGHKATAIPKQVQLQSVVGTAGPKLRLKERAPLGLTHSSRRMDQVCVFKHIFYVSTMQYFKTKFINFIEKEKMDVGAAMSDMGAHSGDDVFNDPFFHRGLDPSPPPPVVTTMGARKRRSLPTSKSEVQPPPVSIFNPSESDKLILDEALNSPSVIIMQVSDDYSDSAEQSHENVEKTSSINVNRDNFLNLTKYLKNLGILHGVHNEFLHDIKKSKMWKQPAVDDSNSAEFGNEKRK